MSAGHGFSASKQTISARWFNPQIFLLVLCLLALRFTPLAGAENGALAMAYAAVIAIAAACAVAVLISLTRPTIRRHWTNRTLEERTNNFIDLMSVAEKSVVIVTGSLNHGLYAQSDVVAALDDLPKGVSIAVYSEDQLDPRSEAFTAVLNARRAELRRIKPNAIRHGVIVDGKHCKVEQFGVEDDAPMKRADYYYFYPKLARRALEEVESVATA
jgi:hypothetical protein